MLNIVLVEPEIPQNTGNIARTCSATNCALHLVHPLGFDISEKAVKRAGLDYWDNVDITEYANLEDFMGQHKDKDLYFATTKGGEVYSDVNYGEGDIWVLFGKETKGLPEDLLKDNYAKAVRIPMVGETRSLNLANSVAVILYEVLRQQKFPNFKLKGAIPKHE